MNLVVSEYSGDLVLVLRGETGRSTSIYICYTSVEKSRDREHFLFVLRLFLVCESCGA